MRICVDLDGTICKLKRENQDYSEVEAIQGVSEALKKLKNDGSYILIYTARRMRTHDGNLQKVICDIGQATVDWLEKNEVVYDELIFGKPYADVYIDDLAVTFEGDWNKLCKKLTQS
jgi:capsule biosynthesis phosphatase